MFTNFVSNSAWEEISRANELLVLKHASI